MTDLSTPRQPATPASPAQTMSLAAELASYARAAADPLAMIEAARTLRGVQRELFKPGMATPATMFAEARILAEGDPEMLAEIDWVQNDTPRTLRIVGGNYVAESWALRHQGDGIGLKPVVNTLPPLRNARAVWGVTFPGKAA
jgi:hypothetical protein